MLFIQMGPLCIHKGTNSSSANDVLLAGQLVRECFCVRENDAEAPGRRDRRGGGTRPERIAVSLCHSLSFNERVAHFLLLVPGVQEDLLQEQ